MDSTATEVEAVNEEAARQEAYRLEYETPWAAGVVEFQKPWSEDEDGYGDYLQGYSLGNGTTLVFFYENRIGHPEPPTLCLLSDEDARTVRDRHRGKHWDLDWISAHPGTPEGIAEAVWKQDLFRDVTPLSMPMSRPLKTRKWEQEAMEAKAAREAARLEEWKRDQECELAADMALSLEKAQK